MRTKNSINNIISALAGQSISLIVIFISRIIFVNTLGVEYLGINGLFTNIIGVLSLFELGIGNAIIYSLYKPIAINDEAKVKALINLYAKIYRIIGIAILIMGLLITPFLDNIIKNKPDVPHLNYIFILYLINSVITYFYAYKRSLIMANQKNYIINIIHYIILILLNIAQIILLFTTRNYTLFILCQLLFTIIENVWITTKANRLYPFIKNKTIQKIDTHTTGEIFKNVRALLIHKIGDVVVFGTDNIIISSFVGINMVGLYSNYTLIITTLRSILGQIFVSITASVGNLHAQADVNKKFTIFNATFFMNFWLYGFLSICLWILLNPFIELWIGKEYLLSESVVFLIVFNFYLNGMRRSTLTFRDAMGLFWNDRYKPIAEVVINLICSLLLVKNLGIFGVLLGTLISTLTTCFWIEPYVLYKYGFHQPVRKYFVKYFGYTVVVIISGYLTGLSCIVFTGTSLLSILNRAIVCVIISNAVFFFVYRKTNEFKLLFSIFVAFLNRKKSFTKGVAN